MNPNRQIENRFLIGGSSVIPILQRNQIVWIQRWWKLIEQNALVKPTSKTCHSFYIIIIQSTIEKYFSGMISSRMSLDSCSETLIFKLFQKKLPPFKINNITALPIKFSNFLRKPSRNLISSLSTIRLPKVISSIQANK